MQVATTAMSLSSFVFNHLPWRTLNCWWPTMYNLLASISIFYRSKLIPDAISWFPRDVRGRSYLPLRESLGVSGLIHPGMGFCLFKYTCILQGLHKRGPSGFQIRVHAEPWCSDSSAVYRSRRSPQTAGKISLVDPTTSVCFGSTDCPTSF